MLKMVKAFVFVMMLGAFMLVCRAETDYSIKQVSFTAGEQTINSVQAGTITANVELVNPAPKDAVLVAALMRIYDRKTGIPYEDNNLDGEPARQNQKKGKLSVLDAQLCENISDGEFSGAAATTTINVTQEQAEQCVLRLFILSDYERLQPLTTPYDLYPKFYAIDFEKATLKNSSDFEVRGDQIGNITGAMEIEYKFHVLANGYYTINQHYAAGGGTSWYNYSINAGSAVKRTFNATGDWGCPGCNIVPINATPVYMEAGENTLKLSDFDAGQNIYNFELVRWEGPLPIVIRAVDFTQKDGDGNKGGGGTVMDGLGNNTKLYYTLEVVKGGWYNIYANYAFDKDSRILRLTFTHGTEGEKTTSATEKVIFATGTWGNYLNTESLGPIFLKPGAAELLVETPEGGVNLAYYELIPHVKAVPFTLVASKYEQTGGGNGINNKDGGRAIGGFDKDEWISYKFNVVDGGLYDIQMLHTTDKAGIGGMTFKFNDADTILVSDDIYTEGWEWSSYRQTRPFGPVLLNAGENTLIVTSGGGIDISYYTFAPHTAPIPFVVEAEKYNRCCEGGDNHIKLKDERKLSNGVAIEDFGENEWTEYDFDVLPGEGGQYKLEMSYATNDAGEKEGGGTGKIMKFKVNDGEDSNYTLYNSVDGWNAFDRVTIFEEIPLNDGLNKLKVTSGVNMNIDCFKFSPVE